MHARLPFTIISLLSLLSLTFALPYVVPNDAVEARFDDGIPSMSNDGSDPIEFVNPNGS
ncbi:MAG: hypothetical protein M1813_006205 [Trichoglossum hirsutum]|nr:MAG: hypothetical protein M1813_006205 [Trichoglossum hirsutum]